MGFIQSFLYLSVWSLGIVTPSSLPNFSNIRALEASNRLNQAYLKIKTDGQFRNIQTDYEFEILQWTNSQSLTVDKFVYKTLKLFQI